MEFQQAKELLLLHSGWHEDVYHPKWEGSFLGSLRPYRGLKEENFHEVMSAIVAVAPHLQSGPYVDREIVGALWDVCFLARHWGIHPEGMLRRNHLIADQDVQRLAEWVDAIEWAGTILLGGGPIDEALATYRQITGRETPPEV